MSKTNGIDPSRPEGSRDPKLGDDDIRKLAAANVEVLEKDHYMGSDNGAGSGYDDDDAGEHTSLTLREQSGDPLVGTDKMGLYAKSDGTRTGIYVEGEEGNVVQIVKDFNGSLDSLRLLLDSGLLQNDVAMKAVNAAGDGLVEMFKVRAADDNLILLDGALVSASTQVGDDGFTIATKDYVRTMVPDNLAQASDSVGEISIGDFAIKWGWKSAAGSQTNDGETAILFATEGLEDFEACFQVYAIMGEDTNVDYFALKTFDIAVTGFTIQNSNAPALKARWFAIGRKAVTI